MNNCEPSQPPKPGDRIKIVVGRPNPHAPRTTA
jgi:hypothetical protein